MKNFYLWVRFVVALVLGACASADPEQTSSSVAAVAPADGCYLENLQHAPTTGACFHVEASSNSLLVACESTVPENVTQVARGPGFITTAFDVFGGSCFGYYSCAPTPVAAPKVTPCP